METRSAETALEPRQDPTFVRAQTIYRYASELERFQKTPWGEPWIRENCDQQILSAWTLVLMLQKRRFDRFILCDDGGCCLRACQCDDAETRQFVNGPTRSYRACLVIPVHAT